MTQTYLSFVIGNELFAVNVIKVLEVLQMQHITHMPKAPEYIKGIINFRGEVLPVFESRTKFSLPDRDINAAYVIIVLDLKVAGEELCIGAIVDRVKDVINIDDKDLKPVPNMSKDFNSNFLQGIYKQGDDFIMMLDVEKVFTSDELVQLKERTVLENA